MDEKEDDKILLFRKHDKTNRFKTQKEDIKLAEVAWSRKTHAISWWQSQKVVLGNLEVYRMEVVVQKIILTLTRGIRQRQSWQRRVWGRGRLQVADQAWKGKQSGWRGVRRIQSGPVLPAKTCAHAVCRALPQWTSQISPAWAWCLRLPKVTYSMHARPRCVSCCGRCSAVLTPCEP